MAALSATVTGGWERLHPQVRRWVAEQGWRELRPIQEEAVAPILAGDDLIVAGPTAGGKTEAAFLPICTALADRPATSVQVLYVAPLKALINDQHARLEDLCGQVGVPVTAWHGDVSSSRKGRLLAEPRGVLQITPESLEALLVGRGPAVGRLFGALDYVVVDELHAFLGSARGRQLQSLLHRIELVARRRAPRIGLSATLGEMALAAEFLRPGHGARVRLVTADGGGQQLLLGLRGVTDAETPDPEAAATPAELTIADHLWRTLRGSDNLIFANSRAEVELYADLLARRSTAERLPNEFFPHHGSLSKESREDVERMLKDRTRPASAVTTSTLELGIDVGSVTSIAQIGAPPSVSALRQRLGRSGRRGEAAVLRLYVREPRASPSAPPQDALRSELVQTVATVRLLLDRWYEPPPPGALDGSTLVQQLLSLIAQHGGVTPRDAYRALCGSGPFSTLDAASFGALLRHLAGQDLLVQSGEGILLHGARGERLVNHHTFYAAFSTPEEYTLVAEGRTLGTLPIDAPLGEGALLVFSGRRWRVLSVDEGRRSIDLAPAGGGRPPIFGGAGAPVHGRVREEMRRLLAETDVPPFLDAGARTQLEEARAAYTALGLERRTLIEHDGNAILVPWADDRVTNTLVVLLLERGLPVSTDRLTVTVPRASARALTSHLLAMLSGEPPDPLALARGVRNRLRGKYDWALPDELLARDYAATNLDVPGAWAAARAATRTAA
ncbi:MAG: ATP-dependent helicase [uncultured Thermoleophilia bacterium]|uniref:ATP-dependent helicase n=1 Tax=uncultured Thermoleophilia bacterium TaxID=1497501 RepID=A0A6J4U627_9ACTN|nr:MAG: ATP-dependent helicase [uncultured Thermoleophilia bacterium]